MPRELSMQYVSQRGSHDCGIAAIAMVTDHPYERVVEAFSYRIVDEGKGLNDWHINEYLFRAGFAYQVVWRHHQLGAQNTKREEWPVKPWAPRHLVQVLATQDYHFVAMDGDGRVLDPWESSRTSLSHSDYRDVMWMMGLWRVT